MRVKSRSVCQTCRQRKYGCDGKRPACSQCCMTGRRCPGYEDVIFMAPKTARQSSPKTKQQSMGRSNRIPSESQWPHAALMRRAGFSTQCLVLNYSTFRWSTDEEFLFLVTEYLTPEHHGAPENPNFEKPSTVCSPWLLVLPLLLDRIRSTPLLSVSLRTLGYSIMCKRNQSSSRGRWDLYRAGSYSEALRFLKQRLTEVNGASDESATAIMCLCIAELLIPTSPGGWIAHVRGIGQMMELCGPESFTRSISSQLFLAFRPLIISEACISRRHTFLSSYEWRTIPFRSHEPAPLQVLLGHGSVLPPLLERIQSLSHLPRNEEECVAHSLLVELVNVLQNMDTWEQSFRSTADGPLYWPRATGTILHRATNATELSLWFSSLAVATSLTYLWAFRAIGFSQIAYLISSYHIPNAERLVIDLNVSGSEDFQRQASNLYLSIRQSIPYFMQHEMKLHGDTSAMFPMRMAEAVLGRDPSSIQIATSGQSQRPLQDVV